MFRSASCESKQQNASADDELDDLQSRQRPARSVPCNHVRSDLAFPRAPDAGLPSTLSCIMDHARILEIRDRAAA